MAKTHNLPHQFTPFIGRDEDIAAIISRLGDPNCRLLTLVGPGGIGKTRLAIEVATHLADAPAFADGICYVDLQPIGAGEVLIPCIANALGILLSGPQTPREQLLNYLSTHEMLLLMDNFEQLLDAVDLLAGILKTAPGVKLLVTSREALNIQGEWLWRVAGLQVPDHQPSASIESYSAVQLFAQSAHRTRQDFTLMGQETPVTRICQLVDGIPLALELAAGWTKALSCAEIAHEIQRGLDVLTTHIRNAPERHRSMQAVFDQSWRLLTEAERQVFPRLTVFRGGFQREAAEQVAGASLAVLAGLVDKSFLRLSAAGRYEIHELTRQYGEEHLNAVPDAKKETQNHHCIYFAGFLHQRHATLRGPEQARALDEIGDELDNIILSWQWAVDHAMRHEIHQSMHSLIVFCHIRAQAVEGERLFDLAVKRFEHEDSATLAYLLLTHIWLASLNGRFIEPEQFLKAIRMADALWTDDEMAMPLNSYGYLREKLLSNKLFDDERQAQIYHNFLERFRARNQHWGVTWMLHCLGEIFLFARKLDEAENYFRQSQHNFLQIGDRWASCWSSVRLAKVLELTERYQEAHQVWQEHWDICAEVGDRGGTVYVPAERARIAWKQKDYTAARFFIVEAIKSYLEAGSHFSYLECVFLPLIAVFVSEGRHERAAELVSFLRQQAGTMFAPAIAQEAHQVLDSLAQQLPPDIYQQAVARGKTLHLRTILEQLQDELSDYSPLSPQSPQADSLSERELEVLRHIAEGHSNRQIARDLFLTLNTVKSHIHHLFSKLGVASRTQAIARARELHLI